MLKTGIIFQKIENGIGKASKQLDFMFQQIKYIWEKKENDISVCDKDKERVDWMRS